jgi:hypothetical protein
MEKDLFERILELHKGPYVFNPDFWKNLYDLRKQLNYQTAFLKELYPINMSKKRSEEEEVQLMKQVVQKALRMQRISQAEYPRTKWLKNDLEKDLRRKRRRRRRSLKIP